ncbi:hypothetical protein F383_09808 [Gossypium arboreum]|uniref:Uncharacterized protein n=1 Tax=Gossypium arboreum TaxID=29729 RepID=A0A0B0PXR9_GOSAR|nr:hypothetical protein F383_09808 [Gossypium arboreum]
METFQLQPITGNP